MSTEFDILASPFFIIKKLQRNAFASFAGYMKGRMLDIGCGTQPYKGLAKPAFYIGIDNSADVMPDACASAARLPFKAGSFDSVICTEVLEHVTDPAGCLSEIGSVLKPGGHLYITAPQSWPLHYEPDDYWRFTKYGLEHLLLKCGFSIVGEKRIGGAFTLMAQEFIDVVWDILKCITSFTGADLSEKMASAACLPLSLFFYSFGVAADRIDNRYALGWAVMAVKK